MKKFSFIVISIAISTSLFGQNQKDINEDPTLQAVPWLFDGKTIISEKYGVAIGTSTPESFFHVNGDAFFSSKLGIGTNTPVSALDVKGKITVSRGISFPIDYEESYNISATDGEMYLDVRGKIRTLASFQAREYLNNSGQKLGLWLQSGTDVYVDSGKVGIGTTTPSGKLDVHAEPNFALAPRFSMSSSFSTLTGINTGLSLFNLDQTANNWTRLNFATILTDNTEIDMASIAVQYKNRISGNETADFVIATVGDGNYSEKLRIQGNGNIGIGTDTPQAKMHIVQNAENFDSGIKIVGSTSSVSGRIWMGNEILHIDNATGGTGTGVSILKNGSIGIGTTTTGTHKLAVEGTIGARKVIVEAGGWSDFVFDNDYILRSLDEVESFINKNNHLPDVPSEKEIMENGISLGEMDATLLQKIEELTLYMIELKKENETLKAQNEVIQKKLEAIID